MSLLGRIFKALLGGIVGFFGILFGGLIASVTGAFQSNDAATATPTTLLADGTPAPRPVLDLSSLSFIPNDIMPPRPSRRPGPALNSFKSMVKEIPSAQPRG